MIGVLFIPLFIQSADTTARPQNLDEVVVTAKASGRQRSAKGSAATIDEHLAELRQVNLIRRGSIFYACTDKMDPVTSYVESSNLKSILLNSGLNGNPQSTGGIGGSLDLKLQRVGFSPTAPRFGAGASLGYETNGHVQQYGADVEYSAKAFYTNAGVSYRHADNYREGGGNEVNFSQFQKLNLFDNFGFRLARHDVIEGTFIYDRATDVGYPALNMDVSKAEAVITSLAYRHTWATNL